MKGKAIYCPSGKAQEFSSWAVNFYNGCSADCDYCYCKKGVMAHLWSTTPTLKKGLTDSAHPLSASKALKIFHKEMNNNLSSLKEHGLFFNFTSDPFLRETIELNIAAMDLCNDMNIPVKALTKQSWWIGENRLPKNVSIGYTLTGMDEMEPGAASTEERIKAIEYLNSHGYTTFASIEPIIDFKKSFEMIVKSIRFVGHYKIGLLSGYKQKNNEVESFIKSVNSLIKERSTATIYWKDSILNEAGIGRELLPGFCVDRDYKFWLSK